jgi:hypothetical protein
VGLSLACATRTFRGFPLDGALAARGAEACCGPLIIDTRTGDTAEWLRIECASCSMWRCCRACGMPAPLG